MDLQPKRLRNTSPICSNKMLSKLVAVLKSPQRGPFRSFKKSRRTLSVVLAVCIVLTIFATFFQSEDILFFYDKLLITDESIQVPYDTILKNRNQLEAQKVWLTQSEFDNSPHNYGFTELTWRKVNNKVGFEPNVNDALVHILNMAQSNMSHVEYIGFGCAVGKTLFLLDHVLHDSMLTCIDADPLTNAVKSYFKQPTRDTAEAAEWRSERGNTVHWHSADHAVWPQHSLQSSDAFVLVHVRGYSTAKSLRTLAERVDAAELNGRQVFVVIEDVDPSDPAVAEALLEVWRASNIKGEFGALITTLLSSIETQPRKVFFVGAESITDALLPDKLKRR